VQLKKTEAQASSIASFHWKIIYHDLNVGGGF